MAKKDKMPRVCMSVLTGIVAYSGLMSIDVKAAEETDNFITKADEDEASKQHNVTESTVEKTDGETGETSEVKCYTYDNKDDYDKAVNEALEGIPESVVPLVKSEVDEEGTEKLTSTTGYTWTDENGAVHTKEVTTTDSDAKDSSLQVLVTPGQTETTMYETPVYEETLEDGTEVYITGKTVTKSDKIEYSVNENKSSETYVKETVVTTGSVQVYDENNNPVTKIKVDKDNNPVLVSVYDEDKNVIGLVPSDENGNPVNMTFYDSDGNEITPQSLITIEYVEALDEDGNRIFVNAENDEVAGEVAGEQKTDSEEIINQENNVQTVTTSIYEDDENLAKIKELLGDYGLTASEVEIHEAETNINAGLLLSGSGGQSGTDQKVIYVGSTGLGNVTRFEDIEDGATLKMKGYINEVILGDLDDEDKITWENPSVEHKITIETEGSHMSVEDTRDMVADLALKLLDSENPEEYEAVELEKYKGEGGMHTKQQLDFTGIKNDSDKTYDVVYATVQLAEVSNDNKTNIGTADQDGKLYIYINSDQIAVINIDTTSVLDNSDVEIDLWKYSVIVESEDENGLKTTQLYDGTQGDGNKYSQQLILNFGDFAGKIKTAGSIFGTIIAPNATFINNATSSGQLICNTYTDNGGEWHYTGTSVSTKIAEPTDTSESDKKEDEPKKIAMWRVVAKELELVFEDKIINTEENEYYLKWSSQPEIQTKDSEEISYIREYKEPTNPTEPTEPSEPTNPTEPSEPTNPTEPTEPSEPANKEEPTESESPSELPEIPSEYVTIDDNAVALSAAIPAQAVLAANRDPSQEVLAVSRTPKTGDNVFYAMICGICTAFISALAGCIVLLRAKRK